MANLKSIRDRIGTVKNTRKITEAMRLVAAAKVRRAQQQVLATRPFADRLAQVLYRLQQRISFEDVSLPLLEKRPGSLIPVNVHHKQRASFAEIGEKLDSLTKETLLLSEETSKAQAIADLVQMGASELMKSLEWSKVELSPMRKKWVWVIRRVIREVQVNRTKQFLNARQISYITKKQYGNTNNTIEGMPARAGLQYKASGN